MPRIEKHRARGGPQFVERDGETISLVPEVTTYALSLRPIMARSLRIAAERAVYVIDNEGVRRITRGERRRDLLVAVALVAVAAYVLSRSTRTQG